MIGGARSSVVITNQHISENHVFSRHPNDLLQRPSNAPSIVSRVVATHIFRQTQILAKNPRTASRSMHQIIIASRISIQRKHTELNIQRHNIYLCPFVYAEMRGCVFDWCTGRLCARRRPRMGHRPTSKAQHTLGSLSERV